MVCNRSAAAAARKHKNYGFEMIAVPADDHPSGGHNVPLHNAEIQARIEEKLGPAFSKIRVLAKSRVNGRCPEADVPVEQACTGDSVHCCSGNDRLYETIRYSPGGIAKVNTNFEVCETPIFQLIATGRSTLWIDHSGETNT